MRHGETAWNTQNRIQGRTDNELNDAGRAQASALAHFFARQPIEVIASSNLRRAIATADAVAAIGHPGARRVVDGRFAEMSFGSLEGAVISDIEAVYKEQVAGWRAGDNTRAWPGGGESPKEVAARGLEGMRALGVLPGDEVGAGSERHVLVAAHGRFNKIMIAALKDELSTASDIAQGNTCLNVLDVAPTGSVEVRALDVRDHVPTTREQALGIR